MGFASPARLCHPSDFRLSGASLGHYVYELSLTVNAEFLYMLFTWDRTVSWDMNNRSPVCGIVYPRVSKSTTSISLNVNPYDSFIHSRLEHSAFED